MAARSWLSDVQRALPEQRIAIHGVRWKDYVILREALDTPGLRMTFCEGTLEIMSPARPHELWKKNIARLLEVFALEKNVELIGYGSTTFRNEARERGLEPDECYRVGSQMRDGEVPDIALEIINVSPLLDKLRVYDGLEIPEVWLFKNGKFEIYVRQAAGGYAAVERSPRVPGFDFELAATFATREDQHAALVEFRDAIRAPS